jgi:hypothetical protein
VARAHDGGELLGMTSNRPCPEPLALANSLERMI